MRAPTKNDLAASVVREMLDYNPATGTLIWKSRPNIRPHLNARVVGKIAGRIDNSGRRMIKINRKPYLSYRLAWLHYYGMWPKDQIDHINLNPLDDCIENLCEASHSQNQGNRRIHCNNTSGFKGVTLHNQKWRAQIQINRKCNHLGYFGTPEEASAAYCVAAKAHHGAFARTA